MIMKRSHRRILLVRHGCVAERYRGVCYGSSDVELSDEGQQQTLALAEELSALPITHLVHSGLTRARVLAELIAERAGVAATVAPALAEINFGEWELRSWDDIFREVGEAVSGLIHSPATFRAPLGETTFELRDRVLAWHRELPTKGLIVAIGHGGAFGVLRGALAGVPVTKWPSLIPQHGQWVELDETGRDE